MATKQTNLTRHTLKMPTEASERAYLLAFESQATWKCKIPGELNMGEPKTFLTAMPQILFF